MKRTQKALRRIPKEELKYIPMDPISGAAVVVMDQVRAALQTGQEIAGATLS